MSKSSELAVSNLNDLTNGDPEMAHGSAEDIVMEFLRVEGYRDVAEAFENAVERCNFWYA